MERKRRAARDRIVEAAAHLIRARGFDDVTIADITDHADVGHGTFYLHFQTKQEVVVPILVADAAALDATLQQQLAAEPDPAVVLATCAQAMANHIVADPLWRWFLKSSGVPTETMRRAFGRFGDRDFRKGISTGRFSVSNPEAVGAFVFGGYVSLLMAAMDRADHEAFIRDGVVCLMVNLGLDSRDATLICNR